MKNTVEKARQCLENLTPLWRDCGALCQGACCQGDETGENGMLLLPGEEAYYVQVSWATILTDGDGSRLVCNGACQRDNRPFACRIFPLAITLSKQGELQVVMDRRAWPVCPLMPHGQVGLRQDFVEGVLQAGRYLQTDALCHAFLQKQSNIQEAILTLGEEIGL